MFQKKLIIISLAILILPLAAFCDKSPVPIESPNSIIRLRLEPIAEHLDWPVFLTESPDNSGRLFIVEKGGHVRIMKDGHLVRHDFLDIEDLVSKGTEQGLLSIAFPPDFARTKLFYANYTDVQGDTVIARFSETEENEADEKSMKVLMKIVQPFANHNGGQLQFGPDGYLYIGMGDGGSAGDPQGYAQNPKSLLGKILRIDVSSADEYQIPKDNPFFGSKETLPEVWAVGLRNPWRFSFDHQTGRMFVGDVGQDSYEEVDIVEKGKNYGWNIMEGSSCFKPPCDSAKYIAPIHSYGRSDGVCVIGGYIYQGSELPQLKGRYIFGDYGTKKVWSLDHESDKWLRTELITADNAITSFGEDMKGELYLLTQAGTVYKFIKPLP